MISGERNKTLISHLRVNPLKSIPHCPGGWGGYFDEREMLVVE